MRAKIGPSSAKTLMLPRRREIADGSGRGRHALEDGVGPGDAGTGSLSDPPEQSRDLRSSAVERQEGQLSADE
jgi:hypothetical protein